MLLPQRVLRTNFIIYVPIRSQKMLYKLSWARAWVLMSQPRGEPRVSRRAASCPKLRSGAASRANRPVRVRRTSARAPLRQPQIRERGSAPKRGRHYDMFSTTCICAVAAWWFDNPHRKVFPRSRIPRSTSHFSYQSRKRRGVKVLTTSRSSRTRRRRAKAARQHNSALIRITNTGS